MSDAPVASPSSSSSSPSSGGNSAPLTFEAAFAAESTPASTPSETSVTPAPAAMGPDDSAGVDTPVEDDRSPFIPRNRFDGVNQRMKDAEAWKTAHAWADGIDPHTFTHVQQWYERARADPDGFLISEVLDHADPMTLLDTILTRVQAHPTHSQGLKSFIGRKLAQQKSQTEPQFLIPQPDGTIAVDMTALPKWQEWQEQRIAQKLLGEIAPIKERFAAEERARQVDDFATTTSSEALSWPGMDNDAIRTQVAAEYWRMVEHQRNLSPEQLTLALNAAWRKVAIPQLRAQSESSLLDTLQQKAHAASGVAPGRAAPATSRRPQSFSDPALQW